MNTLAAVIVAVSKPGSCPSRRARDLFLQGNQVVDRNIDGVEFDEILALNLGPLALRIVIEAVYLGKAETFDFPSAPKRQVAYTSVKRRALTVEGQAMHVDPEFASFTYGDPTPPKAGLRRLQQGDLLVFYAGLSDWDHERAPALYIVGYFVVEWAGLAIDLPEDDVRRRCGGNFHVMHDELFKKQKDRLVLVQGGRGSRLLKKAACISTMSTNSAGQPIKVLSQEAQDIFGDFNGKISIQRSPPRWVLSTHIEKAKAYWEAQP
ncbi:hypothetical protein [Paraburkholderia sp. BCC1876]|uniref:Nmad3 family putative nucleotide modification protein n=1 Tax=Paraburkholderia sp. BCC1876 TaxID=2676303 RepID=UPI001590867D|nr:hypothetical protein [Paraburkholderia sp. BCC1876]